MSMTNTTPPTPPPPPVRTGGTMQVHERLLRSDPEFRRLRIVS